MKKIIIFIVKVDKVLVVLYKIKIELLAIHSCMYFSVYFNSLDKCVSLQSVYGCYHGNSSMGKVHLLLGKIFIQIQVASDCDLFIRWSIYRYKYTDIRKLY